ncbi:MAG: ABC transporter permease [Synergistaceae bacterium]|jgi:osmoprotectant transport system permease protein|nr:ABC transporter permease [Synergistaceae bacterium]
MLEKIIKELTENTSTFFLYLFNHLALCFYAILISTVIGVTLGVIAGKQKKLSSMIVNIANFLHMIPTIALLALLMPLIGIGRVPALVAMSVAAIPAQIINTRSGLLRIDPNILEAADGCGIGRFRCLCSIEIPLALPMIFTGFRTALIQTIYAATIASFIGSISLGTYIFQGFYGGVTTKHLLLIGAGALAILTLFADLIMNPLQKRINRRFIA